MKKIFVVCLIAVLAICANNAQAQFSAGIDFGTFKPSESGAKNHLGFNIMAKYNISDNFRLGANIGYYAKSYNVPLVGSYKTTIMPITALAEYSFGNGKLKPYLGADLGIYRVGVKVAGESESSSDFGIAGIAGVDYNISEKIILNANFKYHNVFADDSFSATGFHIGVLYKF